MGIAIGCGLGVSAGGGLPPVLLPAPTFPSASPNLGYNGVAWTDPVGITDQSLAVYYSDVGASGPWTLLNDSISAGTQSYTDDGTDDPDHLPVDVTRHYKIAAVKSSDAPGSAAVTCSCLSYPSAPVLSLVSSYQLDGSIFILLAQFTRSSVTALDIQVAGSETGDQITPAATKQIFSLPYGSAAVGDNFAQTIELSVSLENASGEGPPSGQVSVLVTGLQPAAPTVIAEDGDGNAISWSETDPGLSPFSYVMIYGDNNNPPTTLLSYVDLADGPYDDSSPAYPGEMWYATAGSNDGSTPLTPMGTPTKDLPITISAGSATDVSGLIDFSSFVSVSGGTGTYTGTCTIDPGDGSGPQAITIVGGKPVFTASGLSTWDYTAAGNGTYTYAVVITDDHGNNASGGSSATVSGVSGGVLPARTAWWKFDEGSGSTAIDSSGNGNTGVVQNGAGYSTDVPSVSFSDPYSLTVPASNMQNGVAVPAISLSNIFSISAWAKWSGTGSTAVAYNRIVESDYNSGFFVGLNAGQSAYLLMVNDTFLANPVSGGSPSGGWDSVIVTVNGTSAKLYVAGSLVASGSINDPGATNLAIGIGFNPHLTETSTWHGGLDDVQIWDGVELDPTQVAYLAGGGD